MRSLVALPSSRSQVLNSSRLVRVDSWRIASLSMLLGDAASSKSWITRL